MQLSQSLFDSRLLCALEGKYLVQENSCYLMDGADGNNDCHELQCLSFPCSIPNITGRGFIEVLACSLLFPDVLFSCFPLASNMDGSFLKFIHLVI